MSAGSRAWLGEISILKQITHKNIVQLLEVVEARPACPRPARHWGRLLLFLALPGLLHCQRLSVCVSQRC